MGRVINADGPGKRRNNLMRTGAELLRRLSTKTEIDDDAKNMVAMLVFCLREINDSIDESARAWEKRDYWVKTEQFRSRWQWAAHMAAELERIARSESWDALPAMMVKLLPHFAEIKVTKFTRQPALWQNSYRQLLLEQR